MHQTRAKIVMINLLERAFAGDEDQLIRSFEDFVRNSVIAMNAMKNISPHFTACLTKIHRKIHSNS